MKVLKTVALLLTLTAVHPQASHAQSIRMSYTGTPGFMTPFWLTHDAGLVRKHGLRGEMIMVTGGAINIQALIAGEVDFVNAAGPALINAVLKGAEITIIASAYNFLPYGSSLAEISGRPMTLREKKLRSLVSAGLRNLPSASPWTSWESIRTE